MPHPPAPTLPMFAYNGDPAHQEYIDRFLEVTRRDPAAMATALGVIGAEQITRDTLGQFLAADPETVQARAGAFFTGMALLETGADRWFTYDQSTERALRIDQVALQLLKRHSTLDSAPDRQREVTHRLRARQLAIFVGRLAAVTDIDLQAA